jgi:hypothetical protein
MNEVAWDVLFGGVCGLIGALIGFAVGLWFF